MQGTLDEALRSIGLSPVEIVRFKELLNAAVAHRRAHWERLTPQDQECWILEYAELVQEAGIPRVYAGMRKAWTWNQYLASAAEVRACLPPLPDVPKSSATHDPHCADCSGTGWKDKTRDKFGDRRVEPCDCISRPHQACTVVANAETAAWIKAKLAELDAEPLCWSGKGKIGLSVPRKRYMAPLPIPVVQLTAEQIQLRKPMERAESERVRQQLDAQISGRYEKEA